MSIFENVLKNEERIIFALRELYRRYGYSQYKMSKFEEYDLYAGNKDFLVSDNIITFTDTNGALMALKPDVTLSIVRSSRETAGWVQKVYYDESVYRASRGGAFKEIRQVGLECIGEIGDYDISEAVLLAGESLRCISGEWALSLSHLGIVSEALDGLKVPGEYRQRLLKCIGEKNLHELTAICREAGAEESAAERLRRLLSTYGAPEVVLPELAGLRCSPEALGQLSRICGALERQGLGGGLRLDFSVVNDMNYYNGVVFKGFVNGVPSGVLSGGQYDKLMRKMGRRSGAVGFAVYTDMLERLAGAEEEYDVDVLLLYGAEDSLDALHAALAGLRAEGHSAMAQRAVPEKLRYRRLMRLAGEGVETVESDA